MNLITLLQQATEKLKEQEIVFAVAGGLVASVYRSDNRATDDVDIAILVKASQAAAAKKIIKSFELDVTEVTKAQLEGGPSFAIKKRSTPVQILVGRNRINREALGLDFILDEMPWVERAVLRAQDYKVDFGFGPVPSLMIEDIIIAKLYSIRNRSDRFKDYDDLQNIFRTQHELNLAYLIDQISSLQLPIPEALAKDVPLLLVKASAKACKRKRDKKRSFP